MKNIIELFKYDSVKPLIQSENKSIIYFVKRDILEDNSVHLKLYELPEVIQILRKQTDKGSWGLSNNKRNSLAETYKQLRFLVDQYELTRKYPEIERACEFIYSAQTEEGDIRGILASQYTPYYTGALLGLLIKAGYENDKRTEKGIKWLLDMRQDDGGWVIGSPGMIGLKNLSVKEMNDLTSNFERETARSFDKSRPFSAAGTGMVLRALVEHSQYKISAEARRAALLLKSKLFKKDNWSSYQHPDNWIRFQFPFWWTNLLSALDVLAKTEISKDDEDISKALSWLIQNQQKTGLWKISYSKIHKNSKNSKTNETELWITLCILRIFKYFYK